MGERGKRREKRITIEEQRDGALERADENEKFIDELLIAIEELQSQSK